VIHYKRSREAGLHCTRVLLLVSVPQDALIIYFLPLNLEKIKRMGVTEVPISTKQSKYDKSKSYGPLNSTRRRTRQKTNTR